ncbi:MAG: TPM domain-containing protein [Erysipelotrichaceae bacterium]|nr:TPM domain-containing protein [Erysipelotrichaceae bacterium]
MKKVMKLLLIGLLALLCTNMVFAQDQHVVFEDYSDFMSEEDYRKLNEDLAQIKENYDIDIYFVYDTSIKDSEEGVEQFAKDFLSKNASAASNVVIAMSESFYYIQASGAAASEVIKNDEVIFDRFYSRASKLSDSDPSAFAEGIRSAYQYVVKLVNEKTYESDAPVSQQRALVNDYSDLLSDEEEEKINAKLQKIRDKYGFDAVVVTTDSFNGMSARDYADDFYDYSQYSDDGIVFILNMSERTWYVSTKGRGYDFFTDYGIDMIFEEMADELSDGHYYKAFVIYADQVEEYIVNGMNGDIADIDNEVKKKPAFGPFNVLISAIVGAISSLITSLTMHSKMKNTAHQRGARNYVVRDSFHITGASDMLVNRHVSRVRRPTRDDSHRSSGPTHMGGGGGSSIHTSSSGSSHGGHGGHF